MPCTSGSRWAAMSPREPGAADRVEGGPADLTAPAVQHSPAPTWRRPSGKAGPTTHRDMYKRRSLADRLHHHPDRQRAVMKRPPACSRARGTRMAKTHVRTDVPDHAGDGDSAQNTELATCNIGNTRNSSSLPRRRRPGAHTRADDLHGLSPVRGNTDDSQHRAAHGPRPIQMHTEHTEYWQAGTSSQRLIAAHLARTHRPHRARMQESSPTPSSGGTRTTKPPTGCWARSTSAGESG